MTAETRAESAVALVLDEGHRGDVGERLAWVGPAVMPSATRAASTPAVRSSDRSGGRLRSQR